VHPDSLMERLQDPGVKRIVELILTGDTDPAILEGDGFRFPIDMGLVSVDDDVPGSPIPSIRRWSEGSCPSRTSSRSKRSNSDGASRTALWTCIRCCGSFGSSGAAG
jgi:hypothetical protein